jgi:calmodulin
MPWNNGFAPLGGHSPSGAADAVLRRIAQAFDRCGADIRSAFRQFDANGDGFISPQEFRQALLRLRIPVSDEEIAHLVSRMDTNSDGMVSYEEFLSQHYRAALDPRIANVGNAFMDEVASHDVAAHSLWQRVARAFRDRGVPLRQIFALFDWDGDGIISWHEMLQAFRLMHLGLSESDVDRLMRDIDVNDDGKVSIQEFVNRLK